MMNTVPVPPPSLESIDVQTLSEKLRTGQALQLIDVREPWELEQAAIAGFENLPLSQHTDWQNQIHQRFDSDQETIVMCHHGIRSAQMCQWLQRQGFTQVKNLTGGIDAYSIKIDPSVPRY